METKITRRDLLNGIVIGAGGSFLQAYRGRAVGNPVGTAGFELNAMPSYYPPTLTGMRGSHDGSYEVAHALAWQGQKPKTYESLDEHYDLVVVGAGMSGLAAAWYYLKAMGLRHD